MYARHTNTIELELVNIGNFSALCSFAVLMAKVNWKTKLSVVVVPNGIISDLRSL